MEKKRLKAEEKRFLIARRWKKDESLGENEEEDDKEDESNQEMEEAVKWAMDIEKKKGIGSKIVSFFYRGLFY